MFDRPLRALYLAEPIVLRESVIKAMSRAD